MRSGHAQAGATRPRLDFCLRRNNGSSVRSTQNPIHYMEICDFNDRRFIHFCPSSAIASLTKRRSMYSAGLRFGLMFKRNRLPLRHQLHAFFRRHRHQRFADHLVGILRCVALEAEALHRDLQGIFRIVAGVDYRARRWRAPCVFTICGFSLMVLLVRRQSGERRVFENIGEAHQPLQPRLHRQIIRRRRQQRRRR